MSTEIELKYHLDESLARDLLSRRRLGGFLLTPFAVKEVVDVYYDTPDGRVAQAGYALRFRRKGEKTSLQLKSLTPASGAWHQRQELHIPTDHPADPERWPGTPESRFLQQLLGHQPLQPLFTIRQKRHEARVLDASGAPFALLSLDEVQWQAAGREEKGWELEIELLPGADEAILRQLATALQGMSGLAPQSASKYERGMTLLGV